MALYAANNINTAVKNFADRSYAEVKGVILNRRNVPGEEEKVRALRRNGGWLSSAIFPAATTSTA